MTPNVSTSPGAGARTEPWLWGALLAALAGALLFLDTALLEGAFLAISAAFLSAAVYRKPMLGVWLLLLLAPLGCLSFSLTLSRPAVISFRPYDVLFLLLLPALFLKREASPSHESTLWTRPTLTTWIAFLLGAFALWGTVPTALADNPVPAGFGYCRFMANFLLIAYLIKFVNTAEKLVSVVKVYCGVGFIMAVAALLTTYYAVEYKWPMLLADNFSMAGKFTLFNTSSGFIQAICGLKAGVGIAGKHEGVQVIFTAELFACYLLVRSTAMGHRLLLMLLILLFETVKYQLIAKTAIVGCYLVILGIAFVTPRLRNHLLAIFFGFTVLNGVAFEAAYLLRPEHMKHMESFSASMQTQFQSKSAYEQGSFSYRVNTWNKALRQISQSPLFGKGPDSLWYSMEFGDPHGHNLFMTSAADYGVPGLAFMIAIITLAGVKMFSILKKAGDLPPQYWLLPYGVVGGVLFSLIDYGIDNFIYWPEIWLKIGLVLCCVRIWPQLRTEASLRHACGRVPRPSLVAAAALVLLAPQGNTAPLQQPGNRSAVSIESGIPKFSINEQPLNNMFGVYVYCTGGDPTTSQFLEEMKAAIKKTAAFFYSLDDTMSHYNAASPDLQPNALNRAIANVFFQAGIDYTFLEAQELAQNALDPAQIKLVVLGDQRYLSLKGVAKLRDYVKKGDNLLLVGSNGVFDRGAAFDPSALESLAPGLTSSQKKAVSHRGNSGSNSVPAIFVTQESVRFGKLPGLNPLKSYAALQELIGPCLPLQDGGKLNLAAPFCDFNGSSARRSLSGPHTRTELMQFLSDFDKDHRRVIFRDQFPGPKEVFDSFDTNHDGKATEHEATKRLEMTPTVLNA